MSPSSSAKCACLPQYCLLWRGGRRAPSASRLCSSSGENAFNAQGNHDNRGINCPKLIFKRAELQKQNFMSAREGKTTRGKNPLIDKLEVKLELTVL
ncbi:hypothetical protein CsSME_00042513 [Camellia sinensis var. sinensis]